MEKTRVPVLLFSWSFYFVLCDYLIKALGSPYIVGMALRIGTVILMTVYFVVSKKFDKFVFERRSFFAIIGVAFLSFLFDCIANIGLQYSTASSGSALLKTELLFVLLISALRKEILLDAFDYVLAFAVIIGSILIICKDIIHFNVDIYSLLFVLSAFINSICAFIIQNLQKQYMVSSFQIAYASNILSLCMYSLICIITINNGVQIYFNPQISGVLIACILCQTTLVLIYYNILGAYPVWVIKTLLLIIPIITLILQALIFRIYPSLSQVIGVFVTVISAALLVLRHYYIPDSNTDLN